MAGGDAWVGGSDRDVEGSWVWMDSEDGFSISKWSPGKKLYHTFVKSIMCTISVLTNV